MLFRSKSNLNKVSVLRSLEYLKNKRIINLIPNKKKIVEIGINGALYKKKGFPERRLLTLLETKRILSFTEAQKETKLSNDEFKIALGTLKRKALIEIKNGKIILNASKKELTKKTLEELFIEALPLEQEKLTPEQQFSLKDRKSVV